jgi:hypothetical protein
MGPGTPKLRSPLTTHADNLRVLKRVRIRPFIAKESKHFTDRTNTIASSHIKETYLHLRHSLVGRPRLRRSLSCRLLPWLFSVVCARNCTATPCHQPGRHCLCGLCLASLTVSELLTLSSSRCLSRRRSAQTCLSHRRTATESPTSSL